MSESILQEAERLIHGNRNAAYGHPLDDFTCVMSCIRAYVLRKYGFDIPFEAEDWPLWMNYCKIARESFHHGRDNLADGAGYWGTLEMVVDERKRREVPPTGDYEDDRPTEVGLMEIGDPRCSCGWCVRHRELLRKEGQSVHTTNKTGAGREEPWCGHCREDFCGCAAMAIGPFARDKEPPCTHCHEPPHPRGTPCPKQIAERAARVRPTIEELQDAIRANGFCEYCREDFCACRAAGIDITHGRVSHAATSSNPAMVPSAVPVSER